MCDINWNDSFRIIRLSHQLFAKVSAKVVCNESIVDYQPVLIIIVLSLQFDGNKTVWFQHDATNQKQSFNSHEMVHHCKQHLCVLQIFDGWCFAPRYCLLAEIHRG